MADESKSIAELSQAVANLAQALAVTVNENQVLKQQFGYLEQSVRQLEPRPGSGRTNQNSCT